MTDLQIAKDALSGHTISLCRDGKCLFSEKRGIAPLMGFISNGVDLSGYSAADPVVGKAAAMLYIKCGVSNVFAKVISKSALNALKNAGIHTEYETLTKKIINRSGTDICPMEKAVSETDDAEEAFLILTKKIAEMKSSANNN